MRIDLKITAAIVVSVILFSTGCIQRKAIVKDTFLLNAQRPGSTAQKATGAILSVQPFSIAPAFAGKDLVQQVGDLQVESDYYNEYFVSPAGMITDQTRNWLTESGIIATVLPPLSSIKPDMSLEGHIKQLLADTQDRSNPQAVLEIKFMLIEHNKRQKSIRFQKTYTMTVQMEDRSPQAYIAAQNACLMQIFEKLEKDLAANLLWETDLGRIYDGTDPKPEQP